MKIKMLFNIISVLFLTIFSFYYTNKLVDYAKSKDDIMIKINLEKEKFKKDPINAKIENDYITPGVVGVSVLLDESYYNMKKLGNYNENLYIFTNIYPEVSIKNNYDKFIIKDNDLKNNIYLIFKLNNKDNLDKILAIAKENDVILNFFIDGKTYENDLDKLEKIVSNNHFLGNLGYNKTYSKKTIKLTNSLLDKFNINNKFCYVESDNYDTLDICKSYKMYTIKSIFIENNAYNYIKNNLISGSIYTINDSNSNIDILGVLIKYIKQKGYNIASLNEIVNESY